MKLTIAKQIREMIAKESQLEHARAQLLTKPDFDPRELFLILDRSHKGYLTIADITEFMWNRDAMCMEGDIGEMLTSIRSNPRLVYPSFLHLILPHNEKLLQETVKSLKAVAKRPSVATGNTISNVISLEIEAVLKAKQMQELLKKLISGAKISEAQFRRLLLGALPPISDSDLVMVWSRRLNPNREHIVIQSENFSSNVNLSIHTQSSGKTGSDETTDRTPKAVAVPALHCSNLFGSSQFLTPRAS